MFTMTISAQEKNNTEKIKHTKESEKKEIDIYLWVHTQKRKWLKYPPHKKAWSGAVGWKRNKHEYVKHEVQD